MDCVRKPTDNFRTFVCPLLAPDNSWHKCHLYVEQNITARSRCLNWHLPYFQQQMPTSFGSRGFILSVKRCHQGHQKVRSLSVACRTHSGRVQTWKRHGIRCSHPAGRNTHIFLQRMFHMQFHPKSASCASCNITYQSKVRYAYCGSSFQHLVVGIRCSAGSDG